MRAAVRKAAAMVFVVINAPAVLPYRLWLIIITDAPGIKRPRVNVPRVNVPRVNVEVRGEPNSDRLLSR